VVIRLTVGPIPLGFCGQGCQTLKPATYLQTKPNGPDCALVDSVSVEHPDGADVEISSPTCWSGTGRPFTGPVLSPAEVVAIAADSRWSFTMDPQYTQAGRAMFGHLALVD
jgi:hypothetical protein